MNPTIYFAGYIMGVLTTIAVAIAVQSLRLFRECLREDWTDDA